MPDAIELLTNDHRKVEALFEQYGQSHDPEVAEAICTELAVHSSIEEKVLYPAVGKDLRGGGRMRSHAEHQHQEVKDLIFELEREGLSAERSAALMERMKRAVSAHVNEEEEKIFPILRDTLGDDGVAALGSSLAEARESIEHEAESAGPLIETTKDELYKIAQQRKIRGRSDMTKDELLRALRAS